MERDDEAEVALAGVERLLQALEAQLSVRAEALATARALHATLQRRRKAGRSRPLERRNPAAVGALRTVVTAAGCVGVLAGAVGVDPSFGPAAMGLIFLALIVEGSR